MSGLNKLITFDIDGVVADTAQNAVNLFNSKFGQNKKVSDLTNFFIIKDWIYEILKDENAANEETVNIWNDVEVLSNSKPLEGAVELVNLLLAKSNTKIYFITSRPSYTRLITINWFAKWFPAIDPKNILMSSESSGLQREFKKNKIKEIGPDLHFEDSIEHALDVCETSLKIKVVLVRQPWNIFLPDKISDQIIVPNGRKTDRNPLASYNFYCRTLVS